MKLFASLLALLSPRAETPRVVEGLASFYHESYEGSKMANGLPFSQSKPIIACWEWPLGTRVRVHYTSERGQHRWVDAVVCDRGPAQWVRERDPRRKFDLSRSLFKRLETPHRGVIAVRVEKLD